MITVRQPALFTASSTVLYGKAEVPFSKPAQVNGEGPANQFGFSVSGAGDVNADGFDDVIIGAINNDGGVNEGRAYVFSGQTGDTLYKLKGEEEGDHFGYCVSRAGDIQCDTPIGYVLDSSDCDDSDSEINPGTNWFEDADGDGYGNPTVGLTQCEQPVGYVLDNTDCNDTDAGYNPQTLWYEDLDSDNFGDSTSVVSSCTQPFGYVSNGLDNCPSDFNPSQIDTDGDGVGDACCCIGIRGDLNGDGDDANILDLTFLVDFIFRGSGDPGGCPSEGDVNGDEDPANILDLTYLVDFVFRGGPVPPGCE